MKKIAIIEDGYVRDTQVYLGDPTTDLNPNWESEADFVDLKYPRHYVGIVEGESDDEIREKAADSAGVHPNIITLVDIGEYKQQGNNETSNMEQCSCGSTEFEATMVTTATVDITTVNGSIEHVLGSEDKQDISFKGYFKCKKCGKFNLSLEVSEDNVTGNYKRCKCGNDKFSANQKCYHDIIVNSDNIFEREIELTVAESPYGTYTCTKCGAEYEELYELSENKEVPQ